MEGERFILTTTKKFLELYSKDFLEFLKKFSVFRKTVLYLPLKQDFTENFLYLAISFLSYWKFPAKPHILTISAREE